jgi:hypothetical protein
LGFGFKGDDDDDDNAIDGDEYRTHTQKLTDKVVVLRVYEIFFI